MLRGKSLDWPRIANVKHADGLTARLEIFDSAESCIKLALSCTTVGASSDTTRFCSSLRAVDSGLLTTFGTLRKELKDRRMVG